MTTGDALQKKAELQPLQRALNWAKRVRRNQNLTAWLMYLSICTCEFVLGAVYTFPVYHDAVKSSLNYTEVTLQWYSSLTVFGIEFLYPAGFINDRFGPMWSYTLSLVFSSVSILLLYTTTKQRLFYSSNPILFLIYGALNGFGSSFILLSSASICTQLSSKYKAFLLSVAHTVHVFGMASFMSIYSWYFARGEFGSETASDQDFGGFLLLWLGCVVACNSFAILTARKFSKETVLTLQRCDKEEEADGEEADDEVNEKEEDGEPDKILFTSTVWERFKLMLRDDETKHTHFMSREDIHGGESAWESCILVDNDPTKTGWDDYKHLNFYLLLVAFIGAGTIYQTVFNNAATYLDSFGYAEQTGVLTVALTAPMLAFKIPICYLADTFVERVPRLMFVLVFVSILCVSLTVFYFIQVLEVIYLVELTTSTAQCITWGLVPTTVAENFDRDHFGKNWGLMTTIKATLAVPIQYVFGLFYQQAIDEQKTQPASIGDGEGGSAQHHNGEDSIYCYGPDCYARSTLMLVCLCVTSIVTMTLFVARTWVKRKPQPDPNRETFV